MKIKKFKWNFLKKRKNKKFKFYKSLKHLLNIKKMRENNYKVR